MNSLRAIAERLSSARGWTVAAALAASPACDGHILVGADPSDAAPGPSADDGGVDAASTFTPLVVPWGTGFESGFIDWSLPENQGFCYFVGSASFSIVTSPVHGGTHAAAFTVNSAVPLSEARCLRQGVLPDAAYYGAWYYVPAPAANTGNWNLLHFRGGDTPDGATHGLWDVSLANGPDGAVGTTVFDFLRMRTLEAGAGAVTAIPIAQWFHLEAFFRRSNTSAGAFTVYLNGQIAYQVTGLSTDDSTLGSWHVGNLATALMPAMSTVYVDDVSIDVNGP